MAERCNEVPLAFDEACEEVFVSALNLDDRPGVGAPDELESEAELVRPEERWLPRLRLVAEDARATAVASAAAFLQWRTQVTSPPRDQAPPS